MLASPLSRPILFGTLGPDTSNHALVLARYLEKRGLADARIRLFSNFDTALDELLGGALDYVLQVTAHPAHSVSVSRTMGRAFIVDAFIAESRELAIMTRIDVATPHSIGLQPATRHYADLSGWAHQIEEPTIAHVAQGLLHGSYDSGIAAREMAALYPDRLRIEKELGAPLDAWVVFGRRRIDGRILLWPDAPVTRQMRGEAP